MNESFDIDSAGAKDPSNMSTEVEPIDLLMADGGTTELNEDDWNVLLRLIGCSTFHDGNGSEKETLPSPDRDQLKVASESRKGGIDRKVKTFLDSFERKGSDGMSTMAKKVLDTLTQLHPNMPPNELKGKMEKAVAILQKNYSLFLLGTGVAASEGGVVDDDFLLVHDSTIDRSVLDGNSPSIKMGKAPTFCSVINVADDDSLVASKMSNDDESSSNKEDGVYDCGRCGQVKKGHTCTNPVAKTAKTAKKKISKKENLPKLPGNEKKGTKRSKRCGFPLCRKPLLAKIGEPPHKFTCAFCKFCDRHKFDCIKDHNIPGRCDKDIRQAWKDGLPAYSTIWKGYYEADQN